MIKTDDVRFMKQALELAKQAEKQAEVPVGALVVQNRKPIAFAFNQKEQKKQATGHAEILAIEEASKKLGRWRLDDCDLYVTLEPCIMCAGAIIAARIKRLIYACRDPKAGAIHSLYQIANDSRLNHQVAVTEGLLAEESSQILKEFFQKKRSK